MKKRNEYIYATTKGEVSEIAVSVDPQTGSIRFESEMTNVYSEVSYDRSKGPKILSRIPQEDRNLSFDAPAALEANYNFLCAVDTNTRCINGKNVSIVGIVTFQAVWIPEKDGLRRAWQFDVPFCLEYVEIKLKPENFGWLAALEQLKISGSIDDTKKIGMVVDSDLSNIGDYNQKKKPIVGSSYLPKNVRLVYASSDAGKENIVNKSLSIADSVSSQCFAAIESDPTSSKRRLSNNKLFESRRLIKPNLIRS